MPTHFSGTPETTRALNTFIKLTRATESLLVRLARRGTTQTLSTSQFAVLEALHHLGPLSQGTLSAKVLKSTGNITLVIDNLEKLGYVRRVRENRDRRMVIIHLTPEGSSCIEQLFPAHAQAICDEFSLLSADEQEQLALLCAKLGKGKTQP